MHPLLTFKTAGALFALSFSSVAYADDGATIRALRAESNAAIARHDVDGVIAVMREDAKIIVSANVLMPDRTAMRTAFEKTFADPDFVTFVRTPARIEPSTDGTTASEEGEWTGRWRSTCGGRTVTGRYLARWIRGTTDWQIASELFVPLRSSGGCLAR